MGINEAIKAGCGDARLLNTIEVVGVFFVCLDGCAARRQQMAEPEPPVGEQQTDRKGKRGLSTASARVFLPKLHT